MMRERNTPVNENADGTRPVWSFELLEASLPDNVLRELFPCPKYVREAYIKLQRR